MRVSTADCLCISGFWGLCPQIPTGALPLDPAGGLPSPDPLCPPYLQTLATLKLIPNAHRPKRRNLTVLSRRPRRCEWGITVLSHRGANFLRKWGGLIWCAWGATRRIVTALVTVNVLLRRGRWKPPLLRCIVVDGAGPET